MIRRLVRDERGMSVIEMLIGTLLLSMLIALFALILQSTVTRGGALATQMTLDTQGRAAVDMLASDLRQATCFNNTPPIVAGSGTTLTFYSPDRLSPYHMREIFYTLTNGTLNRQVAISANTSADASWGTLTPGPVVPAATSVTNAIAFDFYDNAAPTPNDLSQNGAAVAAGDLPAVETVKVTLTLTPKTSRGAGAETVESKISLRTPTCTG